MEKVLKFTYLLEPKKIDIELNKLWNRFEKILKKPTWNRINEARAIIYLTGVIYCEKIAPEAIERRLHQLKEPMSILDFYTLIDSKSNKLKRLRKDELFQKLEKLYNIIKKHKNRYLSGKYYMNEEKLIELYNSLNPDKSLKIKERGKF